MLLCSCFLKKIKLIKIAGYIKAIFNVEMLKDLPAKFNIVSVNGLHKSQVYILYKPF